VLVPPGTAADDVELLDVVFTLVVDVFIVVRVDNCELLDEVVEDLVFVVAAVVVPEIVVEGGNEPIGEP
jgi:hypothetical protein